MSRKRTKFEKFKTWLLRRKEFRYKDVDAAFGRYCQSEHIYLNSLRRHRIVKKVARGRYQVADATRLRGITTGDLHAKSQVQVLRRRVEEYRKDCYEAWGELAKLRQELATKKETKNEQETGVRTEHANDT